MHLEGYEINLWHRKGINNFFIFINLLCVFILGFGIVYEIIMITSRK